MIQFFDVDDKYTTYLQSIDRQVPNIKYTSNNKFVCGIVLQINGFDYVAPISSKTNKQRTNILIYNGSQVLSSIKFSFMFPANSSVLTYKDIHKIGLVNRNYANLMQMELLYCQAHEAEIHNKAQMGYNIGCNKGHPLYYTCCDFKALEEASLKYTV